MAASPRQIAANRQNALHSTGPRTEEGKEASRRNALKHVMTGGGVVIAGEDEHEVAVREAQLGAELAPEGDAVALVLVRQMAIASIRSERAFRHETALAAERMRRAVDVFDDGRRSTADEILADLPIDPATCRRRLMTAPEGIAVLVGRLRGLAERAAPRDHVAWDEAEGAELDRCLGWRPEADLKSRVGLLTRGIVYDLWVGIDPTELGDRTAEGRVLWALDEVQAIIAAELATLEAHRATLDPAPVDRSRAEAPERALLDLGKDGTALRRYAGAAERMVFRSLAMLRQMRREAQLAATEPTGLARAMTPPTPPQTHINHQVPTESASFGPAPRSSVWAGTEGAGSLIPAGPIGADLAFTIGRAPRRSAPTG